MKSRAASETLPTDRFATMPSVRLAMLASLMWEHGELLYERLFGLRTVECRVIGTVQAHQPMSLRLICNEVGIDKSLGSRLVTKLVNAGLLERHDDPDDQRSFSLRLSPEGRALHGRILAAAQERNDAWMQGMGRAEAAAFLATLERQTERARQLLDAEKSGQGQRERPASKVPSPASDANALPLDRETLIELHQRLGALLGK